MLMKDERQKQGQRQTHHLDLVLIKDEVQRQGQRQRHPFRSIDLVLIKDERQRQKQIHLFCEVTGQPAK